MPPADLSRRAFLGVAGATVVLAACGGSSKKSSSGKGSSALSAWRLSSDLYVSNDPQRFVFGFTKGADRFSGPPATIAFAPPKGAMGPATRSRYEVEGLPDAQGIYVVDATFATAGIWKARATIQGRQAELQFPVNQQALAPVVGQAAPRAASPTLAAPMGTDPICTRKPPCPLHTVSLADVIGKGTPVAAMFATPARCQSQYCGPVLDQLLGVKDRYGDRITFVHVEIYSTLESPDVVPTVSDWGLQSEPWLFAIDGGGTIVGRLDGAFATNEITTMLDRLSPAA